MAITSAAKYETLAGAWILDLELDDLINSSALLPGEGDLILPQANRMKFEIFPICSLKSFYRRLHLLLKLK